MNNSLVEVEAKILDDPGPGFQSRDEIYTIASRLMAHTSGKVIGGYGTAANGDVIPLESWYAPGDLVLQDALYAVEYALTRGLNPYGHIHLWYQRSTKSLLPQLIVDIDWKILKGWAEWRNPFRTEYIEMDSEARRKYGLKQGDLGALAYNILDADSAYLHQYQFAFIKQGLLPSQARLLAAQATAKSAGVGIVKADEMKSSTGKAIPPPKGRSWQWRAETRAFRDATRRSHGEPPPQQVRAFSPPVEENHVRLMASDSFPVDLPVEAQEKFLEASDQAEAIVNGKGSLDSEELVQANDLMNRTGDDDPLALAEEGEIETDPPPAPEERMAPSTRFWGWQRKYKIERDTAGEYLRKSNGDFDAALKKMKAAQ